MKKLKILAVVAMMFASCSQKQIPNNEIWYTSEYNTIITPDDDAFFGARFVSNTYENGKGRLIFESEVTLIGGDAFRGCSSLKSITIPDSVTLIGGDAFFGCSSLKSVTIPDSVTKIGIGAFGGCSSLASVTIPDSVVSIGELAFSNCSRLERVYCKPTTHPFLESKVFDNNAIGRKIYVPTASVDEYKSANSWYSYKSYIVGY